MIVYIDCPACGNKHGIYLSAQLLKGEVLRIPCPVSHDLLYIKLSIKVHMATSFEKSDLEVAEDEAKLSDHQWRTEEDVNKDNSE